MTPTVRTRVTWARVIIVAILGFALVAGVAMYWLQEYAYYEETDASPGILLWGPDGVRATVEPTAFRGIDSTSSPIRARTCFTLPPLDPAVEADLVPYEGATPLIGPRWFDCFDAGAISDDLESGAARAVLGHRIDGGVDRVLALYPDGHGFGWNQIDRCGELVEADERPTSCPPSEGP